MCFYHSTISRSAALIGLFVRQCFTKTVMAFEIRSVSRCTPLAIYTVGGLGYPLIVERASDGKLLHYEWVGYVSIIFMIIGIILGKYVKPHNV
jgi:hypothetical protein